MRLVILVCIRQDRLKQSFYMAAKELSMVNEQYVYIFLENRRLGFGM